MIDSITYRWEFELLRDAGRYRRSGPIGLRRAASDDGTVRVAYAIGRPVGGAVVRNRIRRRLREILRELDGRGEMAPGRYLVIVSPGAATTSFTDLQYHMTHVIESGR